MDLNFKECVGLYILLKKNRADLSPTLGRLMIRIERKLNEELTLGQLQDIESFYGSLDEWEE